MKPRLSDSTIVLAFEGWNDAGDAATYATRFVSDAIQAVPLAEIDPEIYYDFTVRRPEVVRDRERRAIQWPANSFTYGSIDPTSELVLGFCIEPHLRWRSFCAQVASLCRQLRARRVVLLGAYLADVVYSRPVPIQGFASDPALLEKLAVTQSMYEGPTGIVGVLADHLEDEGFEIVSLWAALPHYIQSAPNPRGALALVQKLEEYLGLRIDDAPLRERAAEFEQEISEAVANNAELSDYVRQLKRREFAQ